jgi:hypothetical protein
LTLDFRCHQSSRKSSSLVADLLKHGVQQSGWTSVTKLALKVRKAVKLSYRHAQADMFCGLPTTQLLAETSFHTPPPPCMQGHLGTTTPAQLVAAAFPDCSGWSWSKCLSNGKTCRR